MNIKHSIGLNLSTDAIPGRLHMVQGDANSRTIVATLWDGAQLYSIPAGAAVMVRFRKPDGTGGLYDTTESGNKVSYAGSVVTAPVATQMLAVAGDVFAEIDIFGDGAGAAAERLATFRFVVEVAPCVLPDAEIISSDYYNILESKVAEAVAAADRAEQAQSAAAASAEAAATSAANAATSVEGAVKYNTPQTLTDEQKQQARENINAPAPYTAGENISISGSVIATKAFPCNPNLLDNWYFGNPVNQRGQTSYTGTNTYTIDRWMTDSTVTVVDGNIKVKRTGYAALFYQYLEDSLVDVIAGKVVTYSALTTSGLMTVTTKLPPSKSSDWNTDDAVQGDLVLDTVKSGAGKIYIRFTSVVDGTEATIKAVKLELGPQQTLAHQENGVWVLNEIPDYGEQLRKCQRYLRPAGYAFVASTINGNWYGSSLFGRSEPMRTVPAIINGDYMAQPIREVTGGQCATITTVFAPNIYGQFAVQMSPLGSTIPNYVYIDASGFNPLLSAEL